MDDTIAAQILRTLAAGEIEIGAGVETLVASGSTASDPIVDLKRALFLAVDALEQRTRLAVRRRAENRRDARSMGTFDPGVANR